MKREFSKIVLGAVMILYFAGAIYGAVIVWQDCSLLGELLAYIGAPTAVVTAELFDPTKLTATMVMEEIA